MHRIDKKAQQCYEHSFEIKDSQQVKLARLSVEFSSKVMVYETENCFIHDATQSHEISAIFTYFVSFH